MYQRPAKTIRAAKPSDGVITTAKLLAFAKEAESALTASGNEDAAFYFEQLADHLTRNPEKGLDESATRILGL